MTTTLSTRPTPLDETLGFPHQGWEYLGCEDRLTQTTLCQYCCKRRVRYVHRLTNPDWPETIEAGCVCVGKLGFEEEAIAAEGIAKKRAARLDRFINTGWKITISGNLYKTYRNMRIVLCAFGDNTKIEVNGNMGTMLFSDDTDAAAHAFNHIEKQYP